jgi:hypothetical protein
MESGSEWEEEADVAPPGTGEEDRAFSRVKTSTPAVSYLYCYLKSDVFCTQASCEDKHNMRHVCHGKHWTYMLCVCVLYLVFILFS